MDKSRAGRVVAIVLGCIVLYGALCVWAVRRTRPRGPVQGQVAPTAPTAVAPPITAPPDMTGKQISPLEVRTADGRTVRLADGRQAVALWVGPAPQVAQAMGGLKQLAAVLPQVRFLLVTDASDGPISAPLPEGAAPAVALVSGGDKVREALGAVLGSHPRQNTEWWLIDGSGTVLAFGEPGTGAAMMEAELAWPYLRQAAETPPDFRPTPVDKLCPDGANRRWQNGGLALWRHRLVAAYGAYGHHGAWDEPVSAFLEEQCRGLDGHDTAGNLDLRVDLADKVLATECDDPVVVYQCGMALAAAGLYHRAHDLFVRAPKLVDHAHYPARDLYALSFLPYDDPRVATPALLDVGYTRFGEALSGDFVPGEQRLEALIMGGGQLWDEIPGPMEGQWQPHAVEALAHPGADLWLRAWADGRALAGRGWGARGSAGANQTSREQFAGLDICLSAATKSLILAWKLHPDFPEPSEAMVSVAMSHGDAASLRFWAERALAADIDTAATDKLLRALWPRWGGSHAAMKAFAQEMASDALAATDAPLTLWRCQESIAADTQSDAPLRDGAAVDAMLATLDKMIAAAATPQRQDRLRTYRIAVLARSGRDKEASAALTQLGNHLDLSVMGNGDEQLQAVFNLWLVHHDLGQQAVEKVDAQYKAGDYAAARAGYEALRPKATLNAVRRQLDETLAGLPGGGARRKAEAAPGG
jgi:hypothetical protein